MSGEAQVPYLCWACGTDDPLSHGTLCSRALMEGEAEAIVAALATSESVCQECGGPNVVWFAPNDVWNRVMRGGDRGAPDILSVVCPVCFIRRAERYGVEATAWLVQPEIIHG